MSYLNGFDALARGKVINDDSNFQWRVSRQPGGALSPDDFAWVEGAIPEPAPGEVLLKTRYLGLAPVMRMYMQGTGAAGETVLKPGDVIHGRGVAQIVKSRHPEWREGEVVQGQIGWQSFKASAMTPAEKMFRVPNVGLPAMFSCKTLGMTGLSAHAGLFACGEPQRGETLVLSGAAGGVGSIVSQLAANIAGCQVIGIAGGPEKCALIQRQGCTAAIDYKADDLAKRLDALCPNGIDCYFDNVGGETLATVLDRLAMHARIVLCGSISEYAREIPFGVTNYTRLRSKEARMQGFFVYNHVHRWEAVMAELAGWIHDGALKPKHDVTIGFENMPKALARLYAGLNRGAAICDVRGEPGAWL
ncbi:MAG: NADP-dependent oxidoreductase [Betaproteobacteria bacterium]|nr:NADP-dependent oxidoreductase [Betaproteobacteria bacterium]